MFYREFNPAGRLSDCVKCFWIMEYLSETGVSAPESVLPDGCPEIVFNLSSPFRRHHPEGIEIQPQTIIVGQMRTYVRLEAPKSVKLFGIRFHPYGLYPLLRQDVAELTDRIEKIDSVLSKFGTDIETRINEAGSTRERIAIVEHSLTLRVDPLAGERLVRPAAALIAEHGGKIGVGEIAGQLGTSLKNLERQFKRQTGLSPKRYSRILRLQEAVKFLTRHPVASWAGTAYDLGYYDQAHFIKDFKEFTGVSPERFVNRNTSMTDLFVS